MMPCLGHCPGPLCRRHSSTHSSVSVSKQSLCALLSKCACRPGAGLEAVISKFGSVASLYTTVALVAWSASTLVAHAGGLCLYHHPFSSAMERGWISHAGRGLLLIRPCLCCRGTRGWQGRTMLGSSPPARPIG
ncbi:hypothetical protein PYCCODRAFT_991174 [Trametes coccinea BRFM310]|uniref:Uncharacterized protein n=1 Tax=Trametes coccinea (strain BRFM310) TaxID=1353009 RepID=A0A1Y2IBM2_TRAC3|nr:hypothetical protein PYCCODRAFT_991174 [Trametes coccinea BRFM310]